MNKTWSRFTLLTSLLAFGAVLARADDAAPTITFAPPTAPSAPAASAPGADEPARAPARKHHAAGAKKRHHAKRGKKKGGGRDAGSQDGAQPAR